MRNAGALMVSDCVTFVQCDAAMARTIRLVLPAVGKTAIAKENPELWQTFCRMFHPVLGGFGFSPRHLPLTAELLHHVACEGRAWLSLFSSHRPLRHGAVYEQIKRLEQLEWAINSTDMPAKEVA